MLDYVLLEENEQKRLGVPIPHKVLTSVSFTSLFLFWILAIGLKSNQMKTDYKINVQ